MAVTPKIKSTARRAASKTKSVIAKAPGPSTNPATNLLIFDVAMRGASMIAGRAVERALLRARYPDRKAEDIVAGRTLLQSMTANGAARMASRSVPGFLLVAGGLVAKAIFDRSFSRRESVARGEKALAEQAANAPEE